MSDEELILKREMLQAFKTQDVERIIKLIWL